MYDVRLSIPGSFDEVHPYMGYLFLLTDEFDLMVVDWRGWAEEIASHYQQPAGVFDALADAHHREKALNLSLTLEVDSIPDQFIVSTESLGIGSCAHWDIYNSVLYIANLTGLHVYPLLINGTFEGVKERTKYVESPTFDVSPKWGIVTTAAGDQGFFAQAAYLWEGDFRPDFVNRHFDGIEAHSSTWLSDKALAFTETGAQIFTNEFGPAKLSRQIGRAEGIAISSFGTRQGSIEPTVDQDVTFAGGFASNQSIYVFAGNRATRYKVASDNEHDMLGEPRHFELPCREITGGATFRPGVVFDTDAGTFHSDALNFNPTLVSPGENVSLRVFRRSYDHVYQIWSVKDDHIELVVL